MVAGHVGRGYLAILVRLVASGYWRATMRLPALDAQPLTRIMGSMTRIIGLAQLAAGLALLAIVAAMIGLAVTTGIDAGIVMGLGTVAVMSPLLYLAGLPGLWLTNVGGHKLVGKPLD